VTDGRLPLHEGLDALHAWARSPTTRQRANVRRALARIAEANGLAGMWLEIDALPLPRLVLGSGSLAHRPPLIVPPIRELPLRADDGRVALGRLVVDPGNRPITAKGVDQAARALELALDATWARAEASRAAERMAALDVATQAITSVLDLEAVLQLIVDQVRDLAEARYAALGIVDAEGQIDRFITSGLDEAERARIGDPPRGRGLLGLIIREGRSYVIPDITDDPRRSGFPPGHPEMHSFIGVPVVVRGTPVGNLYLTDRRDGRAFGEADLALVETFARHAAIAVENARLHERIGQLAVVDERVRIGRELHDGIIQSIYAVSLGLEDALDEAGADPEVMRARLDRAIDALNATIRDLRNYIFGLRPELLIQAGLVGGLSALADEVHLNTLIDIEVLAVGVDDLDVTREATHELLSIAREALSNVARHAQASRARIELTVHDGHLRLVVIDNGRGMPVDPVAGPDHLGLGNMRDRTRALEGQMRVEGGTPRGTRIIIVVPLTRILAHVGDEAAEEATPT
jgi:signal transduction histidine kinase